MSEKYKIHDNSKAYFIIMTTVGWVDIFTRKNHKLTIVNSLEHCQKHKGLVIFGWVLMHSHLHMICKADDGFNLSDILRDFKKFTSKEIVRQIQEEPESRREWVLPLLKHYCKGLKRGQNYKVWQDGNHPELIYSNKFFYEKLEYIDQNPVEDMLVKDPDRADLQSVRDAQTKAKRIKIVSLLLLYVRKIEDSRHPDRADLQRDRRYPDFKSSSCKTRVFGILENPTAQSGKEAV